MTPQVRPLTSPWIAPGLRMVTSPAPKCAAAVAASNGAPVNPGDPPTTSTDPADHLWAVRTPGGTWRIDGIVGDQEHGITAVEPDVGDLDLPAPVRPLAEQMPRLEGVEGDGSIGGDGGPLDGAAGGLDPAGDVDGEDRYPGLDGGRHRHRQDAPEPAAEHGVDHQVGRGRIVRDAHPGGAGGDQRPLGRAVVPRATRTDAR